MLLCNVFVLRVGMLRLWRSWVDQAWLRAVQMP